MEEQIILRSPEVTWLLEWIMESCAEGFWILILLIPAVILFIIMVMLLCKLSKDTDEEPCEE